MCSPVPVSLAMHAPRALDTSQTFDLPRQLLLCSYSQLVLFCVFCFTSVIKIAYSTKMVAYHDFFFFFFLSISSSGFHTPAQRLGWTAEGSIYGSDTTHFPLDYRGAEVFLLLTLALLTRAATTPQQLLQTALIAMRKPLTSPLKPRNRVKLNSW